MDAKELAEIFRRHDYIDAAVAIERQAAELEALRADAERYRWLRRLDHFASADALLDMDGIDTLDAAIDAARAGGG